uniref:Uncharacterized protein n=1 Tax=Marinobacter nauticus TaxID=2743 RepID=A0A455W4R4_MARNT|nr:hypothetical protein YBY_21530 [Marinobacter nauticus]
MYAAEHVIVVGRYFYALLLLKVNSIKYNPQFAEAPLPSGYSALRVTGTAILTVSQYDVRNPFLARKSIRTPLGGPGTTPGNR